MKKLFTLVAFLAAVLGAKAEVVEDYKVDYSTYKGFPFYVMGYVPEWVDGVMTDQGGKYEYAALDNQDGKSSDVTVKTNGGVEYYKIEKSDDGVWHQYFIADGISTELGGSYTVKAMVKASEACTINVNMGWGWNSGEQASANVSIGTDWQEVEWSYSDIGGSSCNLVAQPNTAAVIEWKWLTVSHTAKAQRPIEWLEQLTNGDAEKEWENKEVAFNDQENNFKISAWGKEAKGEPHPAEIVALPEGGHAFIVRAADAEIAEDGSEAWDNQFWIQSPKSWKSGTQIKIHFRYKATQAAKTNTQIHKQNPSDYLHYEAVGDVNFTTEWQEFDKTFTFSDAMNGGWSIAFNLNPEVKTATDFYFDDLSWSIMKLDEGYFVAGANTSEGLDYDRDNAIEMTDEDGYLVATIGEKGKKETYVSEIMISTVRGNDAAFNGATLKPSAITASTDEDELDFSDITSAGLYKIKLPGIGVWKVFIEPEYNKIAFLMLEGEKKQTIDVKANPTVVVVNGQERKQTLDEAVAAGLVENKDAATAEQKELYSGQGWDNQFFIVANRALEAGEETVISFDYVASADAKTTTQCHGEPGGYLHYAAIGDVTFSTTEQSFSMEFTIPKEGAGMKSIAFNMAEIQGACDYTIKNVIWKLKDNTESLIDQTGAKNFYVKEGAGTTPHIFGETAGINDVVKTVKVSNVAYNIAGQRVAKSFKGLVIKNGSKMLVK